MRRALVLVGASLVVAGGCVTSPKETVLGLDSTDPKWTSRQCVAARRAVFVYDDQKQSRTVVRTLGNVAFPLAGSAVALGMSRFKDDDRKRLNERVTKACISHPPKARQAKASKGKSSTGKTVPAKSTAKVARR